MENVTVVSEDIGSFIQQVTAFRPDEFILRFYMDLMTFDGSASELVGREREGGKTWKLGKEGSRKEESLRGRERDEWTF